VSFNLVWIESNILHGTGITDYRQLTINLILVKYLINVKNIAIRKAMILL